MPPSGSGPRLSLGLDRIKGGRSTVHLIHHLLTVVTVRKTLYHAIKVVKITPPAIVFTVVDILEVVQLLQQIVLKDLTLVYPMGHLR